MGGSVGLRLGNCDACVDGSVEQAAKLASHADAFRALSQLPASHRSLLDAPALAFLGQLWRALKQDQPQTAAALLQPPPPPPPLVVVVDELDEAAYPAELVGKAAELGARIVPFTWLLDSVSHFALRPYPGEQESPSASQPSPVV